MTTTVSRAHFEFFDAAGFTAGDTRVKNIYLPARAAGFYTHTVVAASATPFTASNEDRQLKVTSVAVHAKDPNATTGDLPTIRVEVESVGPDAPLIWYLNLSILEP
jgi:hypothetical protein